MWQTFRLVEREAKIDDAPVRTMMRKLIMLPLPGEEGFSNTERKNILNNEFKGYFEALNAIANAPSNNPKSRDFWKKMISNANAGALSKDEWISAVFEKSTNATSSRSTSKNR